MTGTRSSISGRDIAPAEQRMTALRDAGYAICASYDRRTARVIVDLSSGVQLAFPAQLVEGLSGASPDNLAEIEISPAGLGLHWPKLDADVYVPALLQGALGAGETTARSHIAAESPTVASHGGTP